jgi:hypothetical protein
MNETAPNREPTPARSTTTLLVPISDNGLDREVKLTPAQQQALECLFEGASTTDAAKSAGVSRQTINRWIRDSIDFRTVYEAWHREIQRSVKDRLAAVGEAAMDNIVNAIRVKGNLQAQKQK